MNPAQAPDNNSIVDRNVPGERRPIRNHATITNSGIVANVRVRHKEILVADHREHPATRRARLKGYVLADDISTAYPEFARLTTKLKILGSRPNRGELVDGVIVAHRCAPLYHNMRTNSVIFAHPHFSADNRIRPYRSSVTKDSTRSDNSSWMDRRT
jgi:hypothetical protein